MNLKFIIILFSAILLTTIATFLVGTFTFSKKVKDELNRENIKHDFNTEKAKNLIKLAKTSDIKAFLNTKVEPCNDFYAFACGNWKKINPAKNGDIAKDKFGEIFKGVERKLYKLLQNETGNDDMIEEKVLKFYQSCQNIKKEEILYREALKNVSKEFGNFSFLNTTEEFLNSNFLWWITVAKIKNLYGKSIILSVEVMDDIKNKSKTMLYMGTPTFDMTQTALNKMFEMQETKIQINLKLYFGIESEEAVKVAKELMQFERTLSMGATDVREGKSIEELLTLYNITDLKEKYNELFDVQEFLEIVLGTKELPKQIYVYDESYLENLINIFRTINEQIVDNYIIYLLLEEYFINFQDLVTVCIEKSKKYFAKFTDHLIYNKYRSKKTESEIYNLWHNIKSEFYYNLENHKYKWMSNSTRLHAIEKLNNMKFSINSYNNDNFKEYFKNLKINPLNYVQNVQNILRHSEEIRENKLEKLSENIEDVQVLSYTPSYNIFENEIKLPIALLQPYYIWSSNYPKAILYATLGYLIAHEMIHGFADEGRDYDAQGNANNWWDEKSSDEFELRRNCFQQQYFDFTKGLHNSIVQSENIADNAGVKLAYAAYIRWLELKKTEEKKMNKLKNRELNVTRVEASDTLPRLNFNNRELFFISFAQLWCEDINFDYKHSLAKSDVHSPAKYRVIGPLSNFKEFAWMWKCKKSDSMDPSVKCEIY